ncbi:DUF3592 domain-containing protein [Fuerstiella marisgermanici]|uniref:DUF3592 domain-containing protein n=1 Tax=Fuerstiella marisgermanici TaxID=1891926 RepID=A0A1P8WGS4_9PLAN|nr:hypothetical protein [Fuerstiella marisgermanici]APZ93240.1 hypothetical protein Fuma_02857 [Fuerstiella marisgermanici]
MNPKTETKLLRLRDFAFGMGLIALTWYGIGYLIDANAALVERLETTSVVVSEDASRSDFELKGAKASLYNFSYTYTVEGEEYEGSDSISSPLSIRERTLDGKELLTATAYYDPQDPADSYLEKPDTWFVEKIRTGIVVLLSLGSLAALFGNRESEEAERVKAKSAKQREQRATKYARISSSTLPENVNSMKDGNRYQGICGACETQTEVRLTKLKDSWFGICTKCYFSKDW